MTDHDKALACAQAVLQSRYADADAAFVAGSIIRGEGTFLSDIDLVVLFHHLPNARRESFLFDGFPVEAFIHDADTLRWFMSQDLDKGIPAIVRMVSESHIIGPRTQNAIRLKVEADSKLEQGPHPLSRERLDKLRYNISDKLDDLRGQRTDHEIRAIGANLYQLAADLVLLGRCKWTGTSKWIPRLLNKADPEVARHFESAFRSLFVDLDTEPVFAFLMAELGRHSGPLFEGYSSEAPATNRLGDDS